jgi:hypothetical protein
VQLQIQHYGAVVDALRTVAASGGSEKRRHNRVEIQAKIDLALLSNSPTGSHVTRVYAGLTRDVSIGGLGVMQYVPIEVGQQFIAVLPTGKDASLYMVCKSVFCRALAEGVFGIGAEFVAQAKPEVVDQVLGFRGSELQRISQTMFA